VRPRRPSPGSGGSSGGSSEGSSGGSSGGVSGGVLRGVSGGVLRGSSGDVSGGSSGGSSKGSRGIKGEKGCAELRWLTEQLVYLRLATITLYTIVPLVYSL
jgi:hypothetical protein